MSKTPRTYAHCQQIIDDALGLEYAATELQYWAEKLEEELAAAQSDAERYRWLRVEAISDKVPPDDFLNAQTPEEIDAAIDAAMGEKK